MMKHRVILLSDLMMWTIISSLNPDDGKNSYLYKGHLQLSKIIFLDHISIPQFIKVGVEVMIEENKKPLLLFFEDTEKKNHFLTSILPLLPSYLNPSSLTQSFPSIISTPAAETGPSLPYFSLRTVNSIPVATSTSLSSPSQSSPSHSPLSSPPSSPSAQKSPRSQHSPSPLK
eukprot:TRINITY_DN7449_c0_g1_i1.p1 TRINITY_DN7449_c0_g1~~TRINITY_DN7449_c0_g1_i1.p1  ORF type:complete len:173 (-),score=51.53 TRINITY_DN7449_c0_g1_i1:169-687(-)